MSSRLLDHPAALTGQLRRIAMEAGEITLNYYDEAGFAHEDKADGSPVTLADQEAERFIESALKDLLPAIPMIGEEDVAAGTKADLSQTDSFWLVDPLDGTREFISGSGEYTVNIALIRGDQALLGVVYAPVTGELFAAHGPGTAVKWNAESETEKQISVRPPAAGGLDVVASRSHGAGAEMDAFLEGFKIRKLVKRGSSLKICAVAEGKADLYPRFGPTCEWDTAAAHAVLDAAGGFFVEAQTRTPVSYGRNLEGKWLNPSFIASGFDLSEMVET